MALPQLLVSLDNHLEHEIQCAFCTIFFFFALVHCSPCVLCSSSPVRIYVFKFYNSEDIYIQFLNMMAYYYR